jgi:hypothetical protein
MPGKKVSWQVTGVRHDAWAGAHRVQVEEEKTGTERGHYLHPELLGQPQNKVKLRALTKFSRRETETLCCRKGGVE